MVSRKDFILSDKQVIKKPEIFNSSSKIVVECFKCKNNINISLGRYWSRKKKDIDSPWVCYDCLKPIIAENNRNNPIYKDKSYRNKFRKLHEDSKYYNKVHNKKINKRISKSLEKYWDSDRSDDVRKYRKSKEHKERISKWSKSRWADQEYVERQKEIRNSKEFKNKASQRSKKLWKNPNYRKRITEVLDKARPSFKNLSVLDELKSYGKIKFNFKDVAIKETSICDEVKNLFSSHHYLTNIGRYGSLRYGAYVDGRLAACSVFSFPTGNESAKRLNLKTKELLELTRFCIHPSYQKKNFASWFLSKAVKLVWNVKPNIKKIITFSDTTYNHDGIIYKASGWDFDGEVKADYWYLDNIGCYYHKKTIWDHASRLKMKESEYAIEYGLKLLERKSLDF